MKIKVITTTWCKLEIINKQAVVHKQWHMISQNDDWMLRLKSIQTGILFY